MELAAGFGMKRETLHLAVVNLDRYLRTHLVSKDDLQLIGLCTLRISLKLEEHSVSKVCDFVRATDYSYLPSDVIATENKVLRGLDWEGLQVTSNSWLNLLMTEWDRYIQSYLTVCGIHYDDQWVVLFKSHSRFSYKRFRVVVDILDLSLLHDSVREFRPSHIAAALIYLIVNALAHSTQFKMFGPAQECEFMDESALMHELLGNFLANFVGSVEDLYGAMVFMKQFLLYNPPCSPPLVCKDMSPEEVESRYEEFLAYQAYDKGNLEFVTGLKIRN